MELLNAIGSIASIIGLLATFYTLYKVTNLPAALKQHSRDKHLSDLIDNITRLSATRTTITKSTVREVEALIKTVRLYYVSNNPFKQRKLKSLLTTLEGELVGQKQWGVVQHQLHLVRDEITIR